MQCLIFKTEMISWCTKKGQAISLRSFFFGHIWQAVHHYGLPHKYISIFKAFYTNTVKCIDKYMSQQPFPHDAILNINVDGKSVEPVWSFVYLGSTISSNGSVEPELSYRIDKASEQNLVQENHNKD